MNSYVHHVRGRLRVRVPELKGRPEHAARLQNAITTRPGVTGVQFQPITGSVIVHYRPELADIDGLQSWLCSQALLPQRSVEKQKDAVRDRMLRAVAFYVLEKAAERALPALIAALI